MKFLTFIRANEQRFSQITAIVGFISIFVLSLGLDNLQFSPGQPLPTAASTLPLLSIGREFHESWLLNLFLISLLAMFPLGVILLIFSSEARRLFKRYSKALIFYFIFLLCVRVLVEWFNRNDTAITETGNSISLPSGLDPPSIEAAEIPSIIEIYAPPNLPAWQGYITGFIFALILGLLLYYFWLSNRSNEDELKSIALKAIKDINQGRHWEDAIIQCYAQMNTVVRNRKQIKRQPFLTPTEFAIELTAAGLPSEPVNHLTILFERARYGRKSNRTKDTTEAIRCLNSITQVLETTE